MFFPTIEVPMFFCSSSLFNSSFTANFFLSFIQYILPMTGESGNIYFLFKTKPVVERILFTSSEHFLLFCFYVYIFHVSSLNLVFMFDLAKLVRVENIKV